jgi:predicted dehydrogenase
MGYSQGNCIPLSSATATQAKFLAKCLSLCRLRRCYGSYEELIKDPELDAIYVATPNGLHGEWSIRSLDAGKHVLCEKPFTANASEAK